MLSSNPTILPTKTMKRRKPKISHQLHNSRPLELEITDLSRGGAGFGRDENGRAVFVPFTLPGDKVKVKLTKAKSKFAEGYVLKLLEPSADRIAAHCEEFGQCGGCQWQHIPYPIQWQTKKQGVISALNMNKVKLPDVIDEFPAENIWFYRNRVQLRGFKNEIGFYAAQSNKLVAINECKIAHPAINDALKQVIEKGKQFKKPYKVELNVSLSGEVSEIWNEEHAASGFRQVNDEQNGKLKQWIEPLIKANQPLLDLYGGAGNLSIPLINKVPTIHCVDLSTPNKSPAPHFNFHRSSVDSWLATQINNQDFDKTQTWTALIDPPREGLGKIGLQMIQHLNQLNVKDIILVGCKTDPWARDVALFVEQGWKVKKVAVFDFFPQTYHVESVVLLSR